MKLSTIYHTALAGSLLLFSHSVWSEDSALDDRINVMECSRAEVLAYLDKPDEESSPVASFSAWDDIYMEQELIRSETDPVACAAALYGELDSLTDMLNSSIASIQALSMGSMSTLMDQALDTLSESVCKRLQQTIDSGETLAEQNAALLETQAKRYVLEHYGLRALESYLTDAMIPPEYQDEGLQYRNGTLSTSAFTENVKDKWIDKLKEMAE